MPTKTEIKITGFQITRPLDRLVYDLLLILCDTLSDPEVDLLRNQDDVDILEFRVLALLSQPLYAKHLLRRNYHSSTAETKHRCSTPWGGEIQIHDEAINYFYYLLRRRLGLAQNLRDRPTNMHLLLQAGCRLGPAEQGWPGTIIERNRELSSRNLDAAFFQRTAEALERQHQELAQEQAKRQDAKADGDNTIVARRRTEFGPLWLIVADCAAEIVAELSLFHDVLRTLPTPLPAGFAEDAEFQRRLQRVLESLNERYGLLRSCGLDPNTWLGSEALSINVLKDIKELRRCVTRRLKSQPDEKRAHIWETCFNTLKGEKAKFAGCSTFSEFLETEIGTLAVWGGYSPLLPDAPALVLRRILVNWLAEDRESEADDQSEVAGSFDPDDLDYELTHAETERYLAQCPDLARDALMSQVVRVVSAGRTLNEPGILAELRRLIDQNDRYRRRFGALPDHKLAKALCERAIQIIQRHQQRFSPQSPS